MSTFLSMGDMKLPPRTSLSTGERQTSRKRALAQLFPIERKTPILLDELIWDLHLKSETATNPRTRSVLNSVKRSVRSNPNLVKLCQIGTPRDLPLGIIARTSAYRAANSRDELSLLLSAHAAAYFSFYGVDRHNVHGARQRAFLICEFYQHPAGKRRAERFPYKLAVVRLPLAVPICVVAPADLKQFDTPDVCAKMNLFRYEYGHHRPVSPLLSIGLKYNSIAQDKEIPTMSL